jgi:hypothetical protein
VQQQGIVVTDEIEILKGFISVLHDEIERLRSEIYKVQASLMSLERQRTDLMIDLSNAKLRRNT